MSRSLIVVSVLLATLAGFILGRVSVPPQPSAPRASRGPTPTDASSAAAHAALMTPDPLQRAVALGQLLDRLGPESLTPVQEAYETVVLDAADWELQLFVQWWTDFDPPAAAEWAFYHHLGRHPSVIATAIRAWAQEDPAAARAWVEKTMGGPYLLYPATVALLWGWDESGQPGIWDYVAEVEEIVDQQYALAVLVRRRLLRNGPEATFRWANGLPDDEPGDSSRLKLNTFRRIGAKLAEIDPPTAAEWARVVGEGEYGEGVYRRVAWSWVRSDGPAAMSWLGTLPPGPRRDDAVDEGFRRWAKLRKAEAMAWIDEQPQDPWLDPARHWQALLVGRKDPVAGVEIARSLRNELLRRRTTFMILRGWRGRDRTEADAWIAQQDLPEQMLENLELAESRTEERQERAEERRERTARRRAGQAIDED